MFDWGKDSSSFYPAINYMPVIASLKTLRRQNALRNQVENRKNHTHTPTHTYSPSVVAEKAGELFSNRSFRRSLSATRLTTSEPAVPVQRANSTRSNTQPGAHSALGMSSAGVEALPRQSTMCAHVRRHAAKRA